MELIVLYSSSEALVLAFASQFTFFTKWIKYGSLSVHRTNISFTLNTPGKEDFLDSYKTSTIGWNMQTNDITSRKSQKKKKM